MKDGQIIKQQLTASSMLDKTHGLDNGRLDFIATRGLKGAWSSKTNDIHQWFQVDFLRNVKISMFATQGRQDKNEFVKKYRLAYSQDGDSSAFQVYQEEGVHKVQH